MNESHKESHADELGEKLQRLMGEYPDIPYITSERYVEGVEDDGVGQLSDVELVEAFVGADGDVYVKGMDEDKLFNMFYRQREDEMNRLERDEVEALILEEISNVTWEKAIRLSLLKSRPRALNQSYVLSHYYATDKSKSARFFRTTMDCETVMEIVVCSMLKVFEKQGESLTEAHAVEILKQFGVTDATEEFAGKEASYVLEDDDDPRWNELAGVLDAPPTPQFEGEKVLHLDLFELWERHPINNSSTKGNEAIKKHFSAMSEEIFSDTSFYPHLSPNAKKQAYFIAYGESQQDGIFFRSDASLLSVVHRVMLIQQALDRPLKEVHLLDLFKNFFDASDAMEEFEGNAHTHLMALPRTMDEKAVYEFLPLGEEDILFLDLSKSAGADESLIPDLERVALPTDEVFVEELHDDYFYRES